MTSLIWFLCLVLPSFQYPLLERPFLKYSNFIHSCFRSEWTSWYGKVKKEARPPKPSSIHQVFLIFWPQAYKQIMKTWINKFVFFRIRKKALPFSFYTHKIMVYWSQHFINFPDRNIQFFFCFQTLLKIGGSWERPTNGPFKY